MKESELTKAVNTLSENLTHTHSTLKQNHDSMRLHWLDNQQVVDQVYTVCEYEMDDVKWDSLWCSLHRENKTIAMLFCLYKDMLIYTLCVD